MDSYDDWSEYMLWREYMLEAQALGEEYISWLEWCERFEREQHYKEKWQAIYDNDEQDLY